MTFWKQLNKLGAIIIISQHLFPLSQRGYGVCLKPPDPHRLLGGGIGAWSLGQGVRYVRKYVALISVLLWIQAKVTLFVKEYTACSMMRGPV